MWVEGDGEVNIHIDYSWSIRDGQTLDKNQIQCMIEVN